MPKALWQGVCCHFLINLHLEVSVEPQIQDWRTLSQAASREQDPERLIALVEQLNRVLLQRENPRKYRMSTN